MQYTSVSILFDIFMTGMSPFNWDIRRTIFDPSAGVLSTSGVELLSQMQVESPIGVPEGGRLSLLASKSGLLGNETIDVGVVYFGPSGACSILVIDN